MKNSGIARVAAMAAVTGLIGGAAALMVGCQNDQGSSNSGGTSVDKTAPGHACKGMNACKGQGGCKTGDQGCKGKNSCKGNGGCKTASSCKAG